MCKALLFLLGVIYLSVAIAGQDEVKYGNVYDNIDVDTILGSDRLLHNYVKCLMDTGPCSPDGRELKNVLPDALKTACSKCTEKQKAISDKVIIYLFEHKGNEYDKLEEKYDPYGEYRKRYAAHFQNLML